MKLYIPWDFVNVLEALDRGIKKGLYLGSRISSSSRFREDGYKYLLEVEVSPKEVKYLGGGVFHLLEDIPPDRVSLVEEYLEEE